MQLPEIFGKSRRNSLEQSPVESLFQRLKGVNRLFFFVVLVPTAFAIVYFGFVASDIYVSESRFVIRSPQKPQSIGLGALLQGTNIAGGQDDAYIVEEFIGSRDALKGLVDKLGIAATFGSSAIDPLRRFKGLIWWGGSFESLYDYYLWQIVDVTHDTASSIITLEVRAFSAEQAVAINERLLAMSEGLVNKLNERSRQDMISFAKREVALAEAKTRTAALALSAYRDRKGVFDPEKQSALQLQQIAKLQEELVAAKAQVAQVRMVSKNNPQLPVLQKRIEVIETEIAAEKAKVAGGDRSLSEDTAAYRQLVMEHAFAEKQLATALSALEQARTEAVRKQLYLERIAQPDKPDKAMEPKRIKAIIATFVLSMICWGILTMLIAGVREHHD